MRTLAVFVLLVGCYTQTDLGEPDTLGSRPDTPFDAGDLPPACGGTMCAEGEVCCVLDGSCVAPGDPRCVVPVGSADGACGSNADCRPTEFCNIERSPGSWFGYCEGGIGRCVARPAASDCGPDTDACGCDGATYPSWCVAASLGVPVALDAPCGASPADNGHQLCEVPGDDPNCRGIGVCELNPMGNLECRWIDVLVACVTDADCRRTGDVCCPITRTCHDPTAPGTCAIPPEGTFFPCATEADCQRAGMGDFCLAPSCGGPGGCVLAPSTCAGTVDPVCGCDGATYQNDCEARRAHVRVAHTGVCL